MKIIPLLAATLAVAAMPLVPHSAQPDISTMSGRSLAKDPVRAQSFWIHWNSTPVTDEMIATEAKRRSYVLLNAWESDYVPKLKAANPSITVLVYKDMSSTRAYACRNGTDDAALPTGVGYCDANTRHPEWFLTDSGGRRLEYAGYGGHWQMDIGDTGYQSAWADNVVASTKGKFDGVLIDNALWTCDTYHPGTCPAEYRDNTAFQGAYKSFFANTRSKFTDAGLKTVANVSNARTHAGGWNSYMANLDGGWDEWWLTFSDTNMLPEYAEGWSRQVQQIVDNEAAGKITLVQPHFTAGAARPFRYALASYYMGLSSGKAAIAEVEKTDGYGHPTPWHAEYEWNLGTPTEAYKSVGTNTYRRDFTCGTVIVNANQTDSKNVTFQLGGTYTDEKGAKVTSVSLPGTSGTILRKSGC